jgi:hypothetical protein
MVRSVNDLLMASEARIAEPAAYFIIADGVERNTQPVLKIIAIYRKVLDLVRLFAEAASYLDRTRQELVFFNDRKVVVPVRYDVPVLERISVATIDTLLENFIEDVHRDQKLAILGEAIVHATEPQPLAQRFIYLLDNLDSMTEALRNGYRLFASSFSYMKIRGEIETARIEYVGKIHRTLIDIQGQLLGIPVATIVVASQLKTARSCGVEFWTNFAVVVGAWVFLFLLWIAIINQWFTLGAIRDDIVSQQTRLARDYAPISEQFSKVFKRLKRRICWHRGALVSIALIASLGPPFATYAFDQLTGPLLGACFGSPKAAVSEGPRNNIVQSLSTPNGLSKPAPSPTPGNDARIIVPAGSK